MNSDMESIMGKSILTVLVNLAAVTLLFGCHSNDATVAKLRESCKNAKIEVLDGDDWKLYRQHVVDYVGKRKVNLEYMSYVESIDGYSYNQISNENLSREQPIQPGQIVEIFTTVLKNDHPFLTYTNFVAGLAGPFSGRTLNCNDVVENFDIKNPYWKGQS